jgi:hypothetical protein
MRTLLVCLFACGLLAQAPAPKTVKEVMTMMTIPSSDAVMNIPLQETVSAKDWEEMKKQAQVLIDSANLMMTPAMAPATDNGDWMKASRMLADAGKKAQTHIAAKDLDKLSIESSEEILAACSACHDKYMK